MRLLLALVLAAAFSSAIAGETYRFSRGIVAVGDTVAQLVDRAGQPSRTVQLENRLGAAVGERWEYYLPGGKFVAFEISGGRIQSIEQQ